MFKQTFDFGAKSIIVTTINLLSKDTLDLIYEFIQFVKYDFNADIHLSSGYLFNDTKPNSPVLLTKEFCEYLKLNYVNAISHGNSFMPFYYIGKEVLPHDLDGEIVISQEIVVKTSELFLDTKVLLQAYVVDAVNSILHRSKVSGYLIEAGRFFLADGKKDWDIKFELEEDLVYKTKIKNTCIGFHFLHDYEINKRNPSGFLNMDEIINPKYLIFETTTAVDNKIKFFDFKKFGLVSEFKRYAIDKKMDILVYDKDDVQHIFPSTINVLR